MCVIVSPMMLVLFVSSNLYSFLDLLHWLGPTIKCGIEVVRMGKCYFTINLMFELGFLFCFLYILNQNKKVPFYSLFAKILLSF